MELTLADFEPKLRAGVEVDYGKVIEYAEGLLEHPADSAWRDRELWDTHTLMFAAPDIALTDDYLGDYSNYRSALRMLSEAYPEDVEDASFGHWTYSRFVAVKIRVHRDGVITPAFTEAVGLIEALEDYALIDEDDYCELRDEVSEQYLKQYAEEAGVTYENLCKAMDTLDVYYEPGYGFEVSYTSEEELVAEAKKLGNTWEAHYYAGETHYPEHCGYCVPEEVTA